MGRITRPDIDRIYQVARNFLILLLLLNLIWLVGEGAWTMRKARPHIVSATNSGALAMERVAGAAGSVERTADRQRAQLEDPRVERSIGLLLRTGDDLNRGAKKFNHLLNLITDQTLPRANQAIESTDRTIIAAGLSITRVSVELESLLLKGNEGARELVKMVGDPQIQADIKRAIAGGAETAEKSGETAEEVRASAAELRAALPELVANLKGISGNTEKSTAEIAKFLEGLNRPRSKKEKLFRALITAAAVAAPVLSNR